MRLIRREKEKICKGSHKREEIIFKRDKKGGIVESKPLNRERKGGGRRLPKRNVERPLFLQLTTQLPTNLLPHNIEINIPRVREEEIRMEENNRTEKEQEKSVKKKKQKKKQNKKKNLRLLRSHRLPSLF